MSLIDLVDKLHACFDENDNYIPDNITTLLQSPNIIALITNVCSFITERETSILGTPNFSGKPTAALPVPAPARSSVAAFSTSESEGEEYSNLNEPSAPMNVRAITVGRSPARRRLNEYHDSAQEVLAGRANHDQVSFSSPAFSESIEESQGVTVGEDGREWGITAGMRDRRKVVIGQKKYQVRRKKRWWTTKEDELLKYGVERFGEGRWSEIRDFIHLSGRTGVDLKDRWRTMKRQGLVK